MATNTANFNLRKPAGTDLVNVTTDISDNFEKIDDLGDAFTAYVPVWGNTGGVAPVVGNGTLRGRYRRFGKHIFVEIELTVGTTTTFGSAGGAWFFNLPVGLLTLAAVAGGITQLGRAMFNDVAVALYPGICYLDPNSAAIVPMVMPGASASNHILTFVTNAVPHAWGNGDKLHIQGEFEIA